MSKLPKSLPNISINLLPEDPFVDSFLGKFLIWALSVGRYIVVLTELIVIISFLSRFKLDRDLTDLNESIERQKIVILSYEETEKNFISAQSRINFIKNVQQNSTVLETLGFLEAGLPADVKLNTLTISPTGWAIDAMALSSQGMKAVVDQTIRINPASTVSIGGVKLNNRTGEISFDIQVNHKIATSRSEAEAPEKKDDSASEI